MEVLPVAQSVSPQSVPAPNAPGQAGGSEQIPPFVAEFLQHLPEWTAAAGLPTNGQPASETAQRQSEMTESKTDESNPNEEQLTDVTNTGSYTSGLLFNPFVAALSVTVPPPSRQPEQALETANQNAPTGVNGTVTGREQFSSAQTMPAPNQIPPMLTLSRAVDGSMIEMQHAEPVVPVSSGKEPESAGSPMSRKAPDHPAPSSTNPTMAPPGNASKEPVPATNSAQELATSIPASNGQGESYYLPELRRPEPNLRESQLELQNAAAVPSEITASAKIAPGADGSNIAVSGATGARGGIGESSQSDGANAYVAPGIKMLSREGETSLAGSAHQTIENGAPVADDAAKATATAPVGGSAGAGDIPGNGTRALSTGRLESDYSWPVMRTLELATKPGTPGQASENGGENNTGAGVANGSRVARPANPANHREKSFSDSQNQPHEITKPITPDGKTAAPDFEPDIINARKETGANAGGAGLQGLQLMAEVLADPNRTPAGSANSPPPSNPAHVALGSRETVAMGAWENTADAASMVSAAGLMRQGGKTEMQVELKSDSLGAVAVRAVLHGGEIGAQILVSSREAHSALVAELPALERSLGDKGIHLGSLNISHGMANDFSQPESFRDRQDLPAAPKAFFREPPAEVPGDPAARAYDPLAEEPAWRRLNVHA